MSALDRYRDLWGSPRPWQLLGGSVLLGGLATSMATLLGVPLGILFAKTDLPARRLFAAGFILPLLLPPYFLALGWFALLGREGWFARVLPLDVSITLSEGLFGLTGCTVILATVFLPLIVLLTEALLQGVNPCPEEAARLNAAWPKVLLRITLPIILPGILFGALLVFLLVLGETTVPMFLRLDVYPVEILTQFAAFYDFDAANATAAPLASFGQSGSDYGRVCGADAPVCVAHAAHHRTIFFHLPLPGLADAAFTPIFPDI